MAKEVIIPNQGIRERHLNIVYFIDSSKSHCVRINLTLARWLFAGAIGLVLWSILSLAWIISLGSVLDATRSHLGTALTSIFDYQVKYDHVFDIAYPENSTQGYYANGSHLPGNSPTDTSSLSEAATKLAVKANAIINSSAPTAKDAGASLPSNQTETAKPTALTSTTAAPPPHTASDVEKAAAPALAMDIRNPSLVAQNGKMTLLFDISNKNVSQRAEGYIWAIATIQLPDGTTKSIAAPSHSRLNQDGSIDAFSTTYKFSIQKFKRKDFTFAVPNDETWKVADLKISFVNAQGKQKQTIPVTLPVKFLKQQQSETAPSPAEGESTNDVSH